MKLTKKAEYAIKAMIALARHDRDRLTIHQIAQEQRIPKKFLEQILLALKAAGLVESKAGPCGGYKLARPASVVSLREILRAVDDPLARESRMLRRQGTETPTPLEHVLREIRQFLGERVQGVSLAELAAKETRPEQVEELMWYI